MTRITRAFSEKILLFFKPLLSFLVLKNPAKLEMYAQNCRQATSSGMVTEFNFLHRVFYRRYFRRVQTLVSDIKTIRELSQKSAVVYLIKNKGQLEYRYFNELFLKERLKLVSYSNRGNTQFWWPFGKMWQFLVIRLNRFYKGESVRPENMDLSTLIKDDQHVFLNLHVSRNDLFGLIQKDPFEPLRPLIEAQKKCERPITLVPLQFLYDKDPEKSEKSFFDLLFGEKSCPGFFRKLLLIMISYRKTPQAKFGEPIDLKAFLQEREAEGNESVLLQLQEKIETVLSIERAKITGPKLKPKSQIIDSILQDPVFLDRIDELAKNSKTTSGELKRQAEKILNEIGADVNYSYVHFGYVALTYLWNRVYDGVIVKPEQLAKIRAVAGHGPIVLVPMHRSHIDYLLISYIFYSHNITYPHICAGINMNFWPIGAFFRRGGAFFIRRSTQGDRLYKETLKAYLKSLLSQDYCIEFFIEGTRSRTGKMLKPKLGILKMLLQSFEEGACQDIHFVPIAINYDNIFEEKAYASERFGQDKQRENAGALLKSGKFLGKKYGKVYIEFGDPISFKQYLQTTKTAEELETVGEAAEAFGYALTREMNRLAIVTPISLICLAIFSLQKNSFTYAELSEQIQKLKTYLNGKNVTYSDLIAYNETWAYTQTLQTLLSRHLIKEVKTYDGVFYHIEPERRIQLDYYKNNILHFFVSIACLCKIFLTFPKTTFAFEDLLREYKNLKRLFDEEFTFSSSSTIDQHAQKVLDYAIESGWALQNTNGGYELQTDSRVRRDVLSFAALLDNFLETHLLTLQYLKHNPIQKIEQKNLMREILEKSKPLYLRSDYKHPESLGSFYIESSLKLWQALGLLNAQNEGKRIFYSFTKDPALLGPWIERVQSLLYAQDFTATAPKNTPSLVASNAPDNPHVVH